jgi:seryl-tRNA synthetase
VNEQKKKEVEDEEKALLVILFGMVNSVGNIVHDSVPVFKDEEFNKIERTWGDHIPRLPLTGKLGGLHHHEILDGIGGYDPKRGQKVAGHRGYFLKGPGVLLNSALSNFGMSILIQKGYIPIQPPFFMKK